MFGLVGNEGIALPQKKNAKFYDAYQKKRKTIYDCGLAWWFYHYHFSIANDIECVRIQFEYAGSSKCTPASPPMVTRFDH
jgi:hypothetical protein